ncbi:MAG: apolipoprotein N-acyltransferase [Chlamydiota bacterium]
MISILVSFCIVAFGQNSWCALLGPCAALFGFALFWKNNKGCFWIGTLWFTAIQLVQLSWMTSIEFQGIYILFIWTLLSLWLGLQFGVITFLLRKPLNIRSILAVTSLWTLMEWGRMHILCGFSFNPVGLSLATSLYSMQFAAIFGILGLSFWVILVNLCLLSKRFMLWGGLALFPYLFGLGYLLCSDFKDKGELKVALVQTGLLPSEKALFGGRADAYISPYIQWQRIIHYLKEKEDAPWDFIILPESALPFSAEDLIYNAEYVKNILTEEGIKTPENVQPKVSNLFWLEALSNHYQTHVIAGLDGRDFKKNKHYAAGYHTFPQLKGYNRYEKRILVPLAEYLPFFWLKPLVASYGISDFFTHGKRAKVFQGPVPFAISICYEETFPNLMRESRLEGAELFVNLTNDNWYPSSRLPEQHFDLGRIRAVENGVPLVRACNSGVTAAVDSSGRTTAVFQGKSGVLSTKISLNCRKTLYTFWGDGGIIGLSLFFFVLNYFFTKEIILLKKLQLS